MTQTNQSNGDMKPNNTKPQQLPDVAFHTICTKWKQGIDCDGDCGCDLHVPSIKPQPQQEDLSKIIEVVDQIAEVTLKREGVYVVSHSGKYQPNGDEEVVAIIQKHIASERIRLLNDVRDLINKQRTKKYVTVTANKSGTTVSAGIPHIDKNNLLQALTKLEEKHD